ncbi:hypothetical protein N7495_006727 [Penicillium taxi]|uniref:uncharacterized protein n=1 Tax=Penicillium taxi TaxID=168475 RepID=UPI0025450A76|nr:uncharacterized protein N7495_006727 [Penicillium taxi]KAJ5895036.1 hypothetical protein N7495_006727 [Penicillium taxi]
MATPTTRYVSRQMTILLLILITFIESSYAHGPFELFSRDSNCPSSYKSCSSKLPDTFCCPSSSTCISLDDDSSAICCPSGSTCDYISPIICDIQEQNVTAHPKSPIHTTKLGDSLTTCGDACCPFGYTCQGESTCVLNKKTSSTQTTTEATSKTTSTGIIGATFVPISAPSVSASENSTNSSTITSCPSFPSKAVAAGFFPGAIFGVILALLISTCLRRRALKKELQEKDPNQTHHWSQRLRISNPISSEDTSYRSDFLLRPFILRPTPTRRSSLGGRSSHSVRTRVRSLFSGIPELDKQVPPLPMAANPVTPPRQRQPSTESIKVYTPPGAAFAQSRKFLGPEPYPSSIARPDTTFSDFMQLGKTQDSGKNEKKPPPTVKVTEASI